jgi:plastocyanin
MGDWLRCARETADRTLRVCLLGTTMLALAVGCGSAGGSAGAEATATARFREGMEGLQGGIERGMPATVTMTEGLRFEPPRVTVPAGSTVLWRNGSTVPHTVTADPTKARTASNVQLPAGAEPFELESLSQGQTFAHPLTVAGEYHYVCRIHEGAGMVGIITVE